MLIFLVVLIALIALVLTLVVLVQSGKGGGLAGIAAGGATTQILGARQAPDVLEKTTWVLAVAFVLLCVLTNFATDTTEQRDSILRQRALQEQTEQEAVTPALPPVDAAPSAEDGQ